MAAKTKNAAQNEDKMTRVRRPDKFDESLEILTIPTTSTAEYSSKLKMWYTEDPTVRDAVTSTKSRDFKALKMLQKESPSSLLEYSHIVLMTASKTWQKGILRNDIKMQDEGEMTKISEHDNSRQIVKLGVSSESTVSSEPVPSTSTAFPPEPIPSTSTAVPLEPVPSTSTTNHSASYQSLLLQKDSLEFEIDNIGKVMSCCTTAVKRWLSVIDDEPFPEKEYLQEYMEGTDKLHELQRKEMELEDEQEKILELEKLKKFKKIDKETKKVSTILIHLPNNQRTGVKITKGLTLREAIAKAMERRHLILEDCAAYIRKRIMYFISWDTDISTLQCKEVFVETLEQIPVPVFFVHHFVGNTFLLGYCYFCAKGVLYGLYCKACNRKFHTKCVAFAPALCEHIKNRKAYYERLLANNPTTGIVQIPARPVLVPSVCKKRRKKPRIITNLSKADKTTQVRAKKLPLHKIRFRKYKKLLKRDNPSADNVDDSDSIFSQDSARDCRILPGELVVLEEEKIGTGTFGTVFKAKWQAGETVAIKRLKVKDDPTPDELESFRHEVNILRKIKHKHILLFLGYVCKPLGIVTEFCDGLTLYKRLYEERDPIKMITIVIICRQISEGMDYLHSQNVIHRDLKSKNIFFENGLHVKIGDFGLALMRNNNNNKRELETNDNDNNDDKDDDRIKKTKKTKKTIKLEKGEKEREHQLAGSIPWMAPEVLRMKTNENPYSFQSDVYSFGIVMYEMFTRVIPYESLKKDNMYIFYNVALGHLRPNLSLLRSDTPEKLRDLLTQCIAFEKERRPLFPYILAQTYAAFKFTPKVKRSSSEPFDPFKLPDTYIERDDDVQVFLTSDIEDCADYDDYTDGDGTDDSDTLVATTVNVNAGSSSSGEYISAES